MSTQTTTSPAQDERHPRRRRWLIVLAILASAIVLGFTFAVVSVLDLRHDMPKFASLRTTPDTSLQGTVAYVDPSQCVRLVSASGKAEKQLYCLPKDELLMPQGNTKLVGTQLAWQSGDKLAITMFRMRVDTKGQPPSYSAGWQRVVDAKTGAVTKTPDAQVPTTPDPGPRPTVNGSGQTITATSQPSNGRVKITLTEKDGTKRTLMSAHGPGEYTYGIDAAFWEPNGRWIAVDDGRILVITPGPPAVTRVLVDNLSHVGGLDSQFAVTASNLVTS